MRPNRKMTSTGSINPFSSASNAGAVRRRMSDKRNDQAVSSPRREKLADMMGVIPFRGTFL